MEINIKHGEEMTVTLKGRLDTMTSRSFDEAISNESVTENKVIIDFADVEYISSAGLRSLLSLKRELDEKDKQLEIRNVNAVIREIFSVTGFIRVLTIK